MLSLQLLQEFVETAEPIVTRVEFVGEGELLYGVRILVDAQFNPQNCPADSCAGTNCPMGDSPQAKKKFTVVKNMAAMQPELIAGYQRFMREYGVEVCGIEFAQDREGRCWTYDVNINTNYNRAAERRSGVVEDGGSVRVARLMGTALSQWMAH